MNGTFHTRGGKQQPKPLRVPAAHRLPCPAPQPPSDPLAPHSPPKSPEASLHPANLQGHRESDTGYEQGQGGSHRRPQLSQLSERGPRLNRLCQHGPHRATPNPRQDPRHETTSPRVPGARPGGAQLVPRGCARTAGLAWHRSSRTTRAAAGPLTLSPPSAGSEKWSPTRPQPGRRSCSARDWAQGRAGQAGLSAEPHCPAQHAGTPCPLLAAPRAGQRRTLGMAARGRVRSWVAVVQPHPESQELAAGEPGTANSRSRGQRGRREGRARWPRTALASAAGGSPQCLEVPALSVGSAGLAGLSRSRSPRRALRRPRPGVPVACESPVVRG